MEVSVVVSIIEFVLYVYFLHMLITWALEDH